MDNKQLLELKEHLKSVVEETVNGKLDKIQDKIDSEAKLNEAHRELMKPVYDVYKTTNDVGKFIVWSSKIILAVGIVFVGIISMFKFFK